MENLPLHISDDVAGVLLEPVIRALTERDGT
jgi:hypothetical protein